MPWFEGRLVMENQVRIQCGCSVDKPFTAQQWAKMAQEIKGLMKKHDVADKPLGIDISSPGMIKACQDAGLTVVDGNPMLAEMRMIKNEDEIECLRTAGAITESAHWAVCKALRPGVTEWQMAGVAAKALYDLGAEELEGPSFVVCSGYRSSHNVPAMPTDRIIRPGEMFIIDINGVSFQGYRTCFYRTYVVGDKPTEKQKEIYQACYEFQTSMERNIKPGMTSHEFVHAVWKDGGDKNWPGPVWPKPGRYWRPAVHHLGLNSGDPGPMMRPTQETLNQPPFVIEKNMVFAVEVGTYDWNGESWEYDGVKLENTGVVTENGWQSFYRFPYKDLITCGLPGDY